jgi:hypothetical protein
VNTHLLVAIVAFVIAILCFAGFSILLVDKRIARARHKVAEGIRKVDQWSGRYKGIVINGPMRDQLVECFEPFFKVPNWTATVTTYGSRQPAMAADRLVEYRFADGVWQLVEKDSRA